MASINLIINGRSHSVVCDDGEEVYLRDLAAKIDSIIVRHREDSAHIGDSRLLLLASLQVMDELVKSQAEVERLTKILRRDQHLRNSVHDQVHEKLAAGAIENIKRRVDAASSTVNVASDKIKSKARRRIATKRKATAEMPESAANQDESLKNEKSLGESRGA